MTVRLTSKSGLSAKTYFLSYDDVESQVMQDLARYQKICVEKGYSIDTNQPLDVDHFAEVLFGVEIEHTNIPQMPTEEVLGYYDPLNNKIVCDPEVCNSDGRIAFTIAHETGHISLHSCLAVGANVKKWRGLHKHAHIEWQANAYAAFLLAPTPRVITFLTEEGYMEFGQFVDTVDMETFAPKMAERFGMSWHASEIRLQRMEVPMVNKKYS